MSYSTDAARLLAQQLTRFSTIERHQLVGQLANLDFWLREFKHNLDLLDGYNERFERLKEAQAKYTSEHNTIEYALDDPCCIRGPISGPKRAPSSEMKRVRRELCDSLYRFLRRCYDEQLIDEFAARKASDSLGISTEVWSR